MFLETSDIMSWALPIAIGLLAGYLIATRRGKSNPDQIVTLEATEFSQNMRKGQLIDIRPENAFKQERINGSRNFAKREIFNNLSKLRTDQPVFLYDDVSSSRVKSVANKLARKGYQPIYILKDGFEHWPFSKKSN